MPRPTRSAIALSAWIAFTLTSLFFLFEFVARVEPSLDSAGIMAHFGLGDTGFGVLASLFFWVYAPMQLVVGMTLDRYGARRMVVPAALVCALGPAIFAISDNEILAGFGRILTGFGGAFGFVGALFVANHRFPARLFATLSGALGAIGMIGTAIGVVWLTRAIDLVGWRQVFFATSGAGVVLFVLLALYLRNDTVQRAQGRSANPLAALPGLIGNRRLWLIALVSALYYVPVNVYGGLWGTSELARDRGLTPSDAEFLVSLVFWGLALGSVVAGVASDRLRHRKWLVAGGAAITTAIFFMVLYVPGAGFSGLAVLLFLAGLFGGAQVLTFPMAKEGLPSAVAGTSLAFVNMVGIGGAMLFQPLTGYLLDMEKGDYHLALIPVFGAPLLAALLVLFLREYRHPDHRLGR